MANSLEFSPVGHPVENRFDMKTEEEFIAELEGALKIMDSSGRLDKEEAHYRADEIVSQALRQLGFSRLADKYDTHRSGFWYS